MKKTKPTEVNKEEKKEKKRRWFIIFWLFLSNRKNLPLLLSIFGGTATVVTTTAVIAGALRVRQESSLTSSLPATSSQEPSVSSTSQVMTFTVDFNAMGGTPVEAQLVVSGNLLDYVETSLTGHSFQGWYRSSDLGVSLVDPWNFETEVVTSNLTLYASLTINTFTLTFETNQGSLIESQVNNFGAAVNAPIEPTRLGYLFSGWYSDIALTTPFTFNTMPAFDLTVYAKWSIGQFTLNFVSNGGSFITPLTIDYLTTLTEPTDPIRDGFTFEGWYSDILLTEPYEFTTMPALNVTVYAKWQASQSALLATGRDHVILVTKTGRFFTAGFNLGSTPIEQPLPTLNENEIISKLYANDMTNFFLTSHGRLFSASSSLSSSFTLINVTVDPLLPGETIVKLSTSGASMYLLTSTYRVYAWGTNTNGIFANGVSGGIRSTPELLATPTIASDDYIIDISNSGYVGVLLTEKGLAFSVGLNRSGELGLGHKNSNQSLMFQTVLLSGLNQGEKFVAVAGSGDSSFTLFYTNQQRVFGTGSNSSGGLGLGMMVNEVSTPTLINIAGLNTSETIDSFGTLGVLSTLITSEGRVFIAGFLLSGSRTTFSVLDFTQVLNPGEVIVFAGSGNGHVIAISNQQRVFGFGDNRGGQLGVGNTTAATTVVVTNFPTE